MRSKRPQLTEAETAGLRKPSPPTPHEELPEEEVEPEPPIVDEPPNAKKSPKHQRHDGPMGPPRPRPHQPPHVDPTNR